MLYIENSFSSVTMVENKDLFESVAVAIIISILRFLKHISGLAEPSHIPLAPVLYLCELCALKCLVLIPVAQNKASTMHEAQGAQAGAEQKEPSCHCSIVESFAQVSISISSFGFFLLFFDSVFLFPLLFLLN